MQYSPIPEAVNHLLDLGEGLSRPQVLACSDGIERAVKMQGLAQAESLASDWIGALLAVELEVLTPAPAMVRVTKECLATLPADLGAAREGLAFANTYIRSASTVHHVDAIRRCPNHAELLSRLVVLDTWIGTEDRMLPEIGRNMLIDTVDSPPSLMALDFGMAFVPVLFRVIGAKPTFDHVQCVAHPVVRPMLDIGTLDQCLSRAAEIPEGDLVRFVRTVPDEWLSDEMKGGMTQYLRQRQHLVRAAVANELGLKL